jgi:hypothetical protein
MRSIDYFVGGQLFSLNLERIEALVDLDNCFFESSERIEILKLISDSWSEGIEQFAEQFFCQCTKTEIDNEIQRNPTRPFAQFAQGFIGSKAEQAQNFIARMLRGDDIELPYDLWPNYQNKHGDSPLFFVKSVELADALIRAGADVTCRNCLGETPLHHARNAQIAKLFLNAGADVNALSHAGRLPLQSAFRQDVAVALVEGGAEVNISINGRKNEFLCQARALGWPDLARVIKEKITNTYLSEAAMPSTTITMAEVQIPQSLGGKRPAEAAELDGNQAKFAR